jgi:hypothetical protein
MAMHRHAPAARATAARALHTAAAMAPREPISGYITPPVFGLGADFGAKQPSRRYSRRMANVENNAPSVMGVTSRRRRHRYVAPPNRAFVAREISGAKHGARHECGSARRPLYPGGAAHELITFMKGAMIDPTEVLFG